MKINIVKQKTICDTINCKENALYQISTYSYKGDLFLCKQCFKNLQNTLRRIRENNEVNQ